VILAGRWINDAMGRYVAEQTVKRLIQAGELVRAARVLELVRGLEGYGCAVDVHDPHVGDGDGERLGATFVNGRFDSGGRVGYDAVVLEPYLTVRFESANGLLTSRSLVTPSRACLWT
jgi:UDP-N-acetyl-D-mannosaminuronate dehydrogenase